MAKKSIQKSNTIKVTAPIQNKVVATKSVVTSSVPWWPPLLAMVVTFLCFTSSLDNQFVNWDDDRNFYENKLVQHIDKNNFWKATGLQLFLKFQIQEHCYNLAHKMEQYFVFEY